MSCLDSIANITYPRELVYNLTKLYNFRGKDYYYENVFKQYMQATIQRTIEEDSFYAAKILKLNITDSRLKLLTRKDSQPKTKEEFAVKGIKKILKIIHEKGVDLEITDNEFLQMAVKLFDGYKKVAYNHTIKEQKYNMLTEKQKISKRDDMKNYLTKYQYLINKGQVEVTQAIVCLYIDLTNDPVFTDENEFINLMILYALLMSQRFNAYKFVSFFKKYYEKEREFKGALVSASRNWEYGTAKTEILNGLLIETMIETYNEVDKIVADFNFDKVLKKQENVETIIMKMPTTFTKDDVRSKCPNLSESTLRRALENLQAEGKISSTGTGRSAKWIKIQEDEMFTPKTLQTSIFDLVSNE